MCVTADSPIGRALRLPRRTQIEESVVSDSVCCGPGSATSLFDPTKPKLRPLHDYDGEVVAVDQSRYLVRAGKTLTVMDFDAGQELASFKAPGDSPGSPEVIAGKAARDGDLVVFAYAAPPGIGTIDLATRRASEPLKIPLCRAD